MGVGSNLGAQGLIALFFAPNSSVRQEEPLLPRQAFNRFGFGSRKGNLEGFEGDSSPAKVPDVLSDGQLAVDVWAVGAELRGDQLVVLGDETLGALLEGRAIVDRPPVTQQTLAITRRALIVETMTDLVADDRTDPAIVDGVVSLDVEEWRLQDGRRENDLIAQWVVIGIDRLGEHQPLVRVHGSREFLDGVIELKRTAGQGGIDETAVGQLEP